MKTRAVYPYVKSNNIIEEPTGQRRLFRVVNTETGALLTPQLTETKEVRKSAMFTFADMCGLTLDGGKYEAVPTNHFCLSRNK